MLFRSGIRTYADFKAMIDAGADRIAAGLDWARTKITGGEREVVSSAGGRGKGLKRGLSAADEVMKTGTNLWEGTEKVTSGQGANAWGYGGELEFKNKIAVSIVRKKVAHFEQRRILLLGKPFDFGKNCFFNRVFHTKIISRISILRTKEMAANKVVFFDFCPGRERFGAFFLRIRAARSERTARNGGENRFDFAFSAVSFVEES